MPLADTLNRKPGDILKSDDWNIIIKEIDRLETAKINRDGADTLKGPLTIAEALNANSNVTIKGSLSIVVPQPQEPSGQILVLGPTNASNLRLGYHQDYSWIQSHGSKPLLINRLGNNIGIGSTINPVASLDIASASRTGTHPTAVKGLYITGDFNADNDGVEFRHSSGTQGIGFGFNTIYAAGSNANQDLGLKPKGTGEVKVSGSLSVSGIVKAQALTLSQSGGQSSGMASFMSKNPEPPYINWYHSRSGADQDLKRYGYIQAGDDGIKEFRFVAENGANFKFSGGNLTVTGNVGIATTAPPSERLEVNGNIKATSFLGRIDAVNITSGTLNVERIPNLSAEKITSGTLTGSYSINGNLSITFDSYFGCQSQDRFTYDNKSIGHYSLGWFRDSWQTNGPTAWLSSFGGIKFFTTGQPRLMIDALGKVSVTGNLSVTNILEIGDTPFTGGGNRDWMQKGIRINWDSDSLFVGLKDEGSNRKDAVIAWGDDLQDDLRFINVLAGGDVQGKELMRIKPSGNVFINGTLVTQQTHTIKIGVPSSTYGNDGIRGEPNLWLDAAGTVFIKSGFQSRGLDVAERFKVLGHGEIGSVMVMDEQEKAIKLCERAYDPCVVGIISGEPAFILGLETEHQPIALCGRVPCNVDADIAPIKVGDLLTTSPTKGYAQKALEIAKATGTIIGKALESLSQGKGQITVLVILQ